MKRICECVNEPLLKYGGFFGKLWNWHLQKTLLHRQLSQPVFEVPVIVLLNRENSNNFVFS
jgi:hypothetical protein